MIKVYKVNKSNKVLVIKVSEAEVSTQSRSSGYILTIEF